MTMLLISADDAQAIANYLGRCPYAQVANLVKILLTLQEVPEPPKKDPCPPIPA